MENLLSPSSSEYKPLEQTFLANYSAKPFCKTYFPLFIYYCKGSTVHFHFHSEEKKKKKKTQCTLDGKDETFTSAVLVSSLL